jgi:hypothetical protein
VQSKNAEEKYGIYVAIFDAGKDSFDFKGILYLTNPE